MTVPGHIFERARNVWDIFYNWQEDAIGKDYAERARQLRTSIQPPSCSDDNAPRAAIIVPEDADPRIEYLQPNELDYIRNFCLFHQINATDPKEAVRLLQWLLANQRKTFTEKMALLDDLHAGLWLIEPNWIATRIAMGLGATPEAPILSEPSIRTLYRELRTKLDQAKRAPDLNSWWYQMHCLTPRILLATRHSVALGEEEGPKYYRFFDEVLTDYSSYMSIAMGGWLTGAPWPICCSIFFRPFGRADPNNIYDERTLRYNLPFFWYDAARDARESILTIQDIVLKKKLSFEQAQNSGLNRLPDALDAFSPHLLSAIMALKWSKLQF
jgi:hypothetical protein